jgi:hypothetical protein
MRKGTALKCSSKEPGYKPLKDKCKHFLGKVENGETFIYCKKCKSFHQLSELAKD